MTQYTAVPTVATGNTYPAATYNTYVKDNFDALAKSKMGVVYKSAAQTIATATATQVTWPASITLVDVGLVSNNLQVTYAGWYMVTVALEWEANATGYRHLLVRLNGTTNVAQAAAAAASGQVTVTSVAAPIQLAATNTLEVIAQQNSGVSLTINAGSASSLFTATMVSW